jgi:dolichol-phosphate mannosyltransferase
MSVPSPGRRVSVIVPVYFNAESLAPLSDALAAVERQLAERAVDLELVFVDDGSRDDSFARLLELKRRRPATRLIRHSRNFGAVHASKTGLQHATGDCVSVMAADLQDPPELIVAMVDHWLRGAPYVVCARRTRDDGVIAGLFSRLYYVLLRGLVTRDYPTGGYDMSLMDKVFLPYLTTSSKNINLQLFAHWLGFTPVVIPYDRPRRAHGRSRWSLAKRVTFLLDSLLGFSIVPIRVISAVGFAVSLSSFAYGSMIAFNALRGRVDERGFATIVTLLSFLLGLVIVMLGILGEYLWRVFDEVNKRPESVIAEIL